MDKDTKLQITKDKLLKSTFELMEESDDPLAVTSRQIAAAADVQASMINYCFGSRENLIYQVFQTQYLSFLGTEEVQKILSSGMSPKDILKKLHLLVAQVLVENHKFTRAITSFVLFKRDLTRQSFSYPYVYKHYRGSKSESECMLIAYEMSTMMQLLICRKDELKAGFGIDLDDKAQLKKYVDLRIDLLLED